MSRLEGIRVVASAVLLVLLLALVPLIASLLGVALYERVAIELLVNVVLVAGLQIFVGNSGIISFGHAAFMGIGAYAAVLVTIPVASKGMLLPDLYAPIRDIEGPFVAGLLAAAVVAAFVAALVGVPLVRLSGAGAAIATFALLVVVNVVLRNWDAVTRGTSPLFGVPGATTLWVAYFWAAVALLAAFLFKHTRFGLQLRATREDEQAAASHGINVAAVRWVALVVSAALTGVGGALWAHFITAFSVTAFFFGATFSVLVMLIVGGMRSVTGSVVGAVVVTVGMRLLRDVESGLTVGDAQLGPFFGLSQLSLAVGIVLILVFRRRGIMGDTELSLPGPLLRVLSAGTRARH